MSNERTRFVIIDGNAIIHRAYHALPPMTTKDGTVVNAVFGFTSMLLKTIEDLKPTHLAVSFDVAGKTFRDEMYEDYKATRVKADQDLYDQIPLVYDIVRAFDIPIYTQEGYEADDVIGTIVNNSELRTPNSELIIVTGDMDMLQLVDDEVVKVYELRRGLSDIVLFDAKKVKEKYGFGPERIVDYKALRGDVSDNIPGVKGIGEKGAKELIEKIGGIEEIYKEIKDNRAEITDKLKPALIKKLEEGEDDAKMSKELATIYTDVKELDFRLQTSDFTPQNLDQNKISDLLKKLEFFSLLKRLPWAGKKSEVRSPKSNRRKTNFEIVEESNLPGFLKNLKAAPEFCCKEVLSGKDVMTSEFTGLVFCFDSKSFYVDFKKIKDKDKILAVFFEKEGLLIGHDLKQLVKAIFLGTSRKDISVRLFDVMVASYVVNSSTRSHDLKGMVMRELAEDLPRGSEQDSLFGIDPKVLAEELGLINRLYKKLVEDLEEKEDRSLFDDIEMKLIPVLAEMETHGIGVDTKVLEKLSSDAKREIEKLVKKIHKEAGEEFNVASSIQLRDVLFDRLGLPTDTVKKGKTGYSTAASELEKLRGLHPIIEHVEDFREIEKLRNTYIDVLPGLVNKKTGRIHTSFNQTVAATGRLSSSDPNLQNIPARTELGREVRNAFVAEKGFTLVAADYSQIELRIVASLAGDSKLIEIFKNGEDVHTATAAAINGVPLGKVNHQMRYAAKEVNFGVLYGMGAYGLSWRAGIPQAEAREFIEKYFEEFNGVKKYVDRTIKFAKEEGFVETLFGRRRYIPELSSANYQLRSAGERMAVNMPIQGTAADLMKLAMINVHEKISGPKSEVRPTEVRMILQVHDELVLEVKEGLEKKVGKLVQETMESVTKLRVPIEVHVKIGKSWGNLE